MQDNERKIGQLEGRLDGLEKRIDSVEKNINERLNKIEKTQDSIGVDISKIKEAVLTIKVSYKTLTIVGAIAAGIVAALSSLFSQIWPLIVPFFTK